MPNIPVVNMQGKEVGTMELKDEIFAVEVNTAAMHLVVRSYLAAQRQGTQSALTRGMVRGGGRKIYRQKGTGNARHHGRRAPQFTHGGVVFAPKPRDYVVSVNRKVRALAFKSAMTSKFNDGEIIVIDKLALEAPKTRLMAGVVSKFETKGTTMVVMANQDANVILAARNLAEVETINANNLNVYDILRCGKLMLTQDALKQIEEVNA